jgi:hypothetical protein
MAAVIDMRVYRGLIYIPVDYETGEDNPSPERTIWVELNNDALMDRTRQLDILFPNPTEFYNFKYMLKQMATRVDTAEEYVVIKYKGELYRMTDLGLIHHNTGDFTPNYIAHTIIEKEDKDYKYVEELYSAGEVPALSPGHRAPAWLGGGQVPDPARRRP